MEGPDTVRRMAEGSRDDGTEKEKARAEEGAGQPESACRGESPGKQISS